MKKKYNKRIEEGFRDIFKTDMEQISSENYLNNSQDSLITIVKDPLVKHQIIQLAKLSEEVPLNLAVTPSNNAILIEFWK